MADPIRVLHLVDCLRVGGTERQLVGLLSHFDRRRVACEVACLQRVGELLPELERLGHAAPEFPLRGSLAQLNTLVQLARLARLARRARIEVIHAHDYYANLVGFALARLTGRPAIVSRRDLGHWLGGAHRRLLGAVSRLADCVLCNAEAVALEVWQSDAVPTTRLCVVPNGIDPERFDAAAQRGLAAPLPARRPGALRVAVIASMNRADKGHEDVLHAARTLADRGRAIDWLLLGDGLLRPLYQTRAVRMGLSATVHFLGSRADVAAVLAQVDLVVHPSWSEGSPNALLEAMCAGRPVVATRVGGAPELVLTDGARATGVLVPARAPLALALAVEALWAAPDRAAALGWSGRARIASEFTVARACARTEAVYRWIARAGGERHVRLGSGRPASGRAGVGPA
jgi:glycosyltransferase involved in cell wall biosynthesis